MPAFSYKAKSFAGETKLGTAEAKDERELAKVLHGQGYVLVSAVSAEKKKRGRGLSIGFGRVSLKDKLMFTKNLQVMLAAGISLPQALRTLSLQTKSKKFQNALNNIADEISRGKNFSDALQKFPSIFSEFFFYMIKVGEESGTLTEVLKNLGFQMEREYELKSKIKGALIYPAVIISVMIIIAILMLILVVPKLAQVFKDMKVELPLTTKIVINSGDFLKSNFLFIIIAILAIVLFLRFFFKTFEGRKIKDSILLKMPIVAPIIKKMNASTVIRNLGILTASGVPLLRSLEIIYGILSNVYFKHAMQEAKDTIQAGGKLSSAFEKYTRLFSPTVVNMVQVGEETGETSKILTELADFYEEELSTATKNLVSVIEPLLMVLIGAAVGFFAISIIQPIYSMMGSFG